MELGHAVYPGRSELNLDACIVRDHDGDGVGDFQASIDLNVGVADPLLDAAGGLRAGSAAIDFAGQSYPAPLYDLAGRRRILGNAGIADLGATEFQEFDGFGPFDVGEADELGRALPGPQLVIEVMAVDPEVWLVIRAVPPDREFGPLAHILWDVGAEGAVESRAAELEIALTELAGQQLTLRVIDLFGRVRESTVDFSDHDADGLPDFWELQYFGHSYADAAADPDGDGWDNWAEFLANSNPADPADPVQGIR